MKAFLALALAAVPAWADDLASMQLAQQIGTIIGSEQACGLTLDQPAIQAFIQEKVDPADMNFAPTLNMMTQGTQMQVDQMSASAKTAHCTAVAQSAKHFGLTK